MVLPIPNSSMLVFPIRMAPAARSRATLVASKAGVYPSNDLEPAVVGMPWVQILSCRCSGCQACHLL